MTDTLPHNDPALCTRRCLWLLAGVFALRLLYQFYILDCDLAGDETYYWDWGRRLDWCYYSKPPMIGWLMRLVGWLSGDAAWAVRVASVLCGTTMLWLVFLLGRAMYGARSGFIAMLLLLLTPANVILNIAFTIDVPLMLCWVLALLSYWCAVQKPQRWGWWCVLALAIGLGCLAKQMMLVFPAMMLFFACTSLEDRGLLRRPQFWLSIGAGMAFLLPVLLWQRAHGWITAQHMQENFVVEPLGFIGWWVQLLRFPVLQAATYSPITWGIVIAALVVCLRGWAAAGRRERFLVAFSAPALLGFLLLAMRQYVNENWPAVFYVSAFVLAAGLVAQRSTWQPWLRRGLWLGGSLVALVYIAMPVILNSSLLANPKFERITELLGWREAGRQAGELLKTVPRPNETFVLVLDKRQNASGMAFYMPQHPRVFRWSKEGHIESQYEVWPSAADKVGQDAFIIYPDIEKGSVTVKQPLSVFIRRAFESTEKLGDIAGPIGSERKRSFQVFLGKNMKRFPPPIAEQVEEMKRLGQKAALPPKYKTQEAAK